MNISRGKIHKYLGMNLDFSEPVEVNITMIPYIECIMKYFAKHDDPMNTFSTP